MTDAGTATPTTPSAQPDAHRVDPLASERIMAELIAVATGESIDRVLERLRIEYARPGATVRHALRERGVTPHEWSAELERFYEESDAFLYELAIWNHNRLKGRMRRWIADTLARASTEALSILSIGDGLGFDSLSFAERGHAVTYLEVPGCTERFARAMFRRVGANIMIETDPAALAESSFDVVVALDVLEHVPDPPVFLSQLLRPLRLGGLFIVHSPFYMIHRAYRTHLRTNRRWAGAMSLYEKAGLRLCDGRLGWNPLVFSLGRPAAGLAPRHPIKTLPLRISGLYQSLGRRVTFPFLPIHWLRRAQARRFQP